MNKKSVLIVNGIASNAMGLVTQQEGSIPYQLADTGLWDVWMISNRGSALSRKHLWLDPDSEIEYWNFSFEEFGKYDLKTAVEFIQKERQNDDKITLMGYS